MQKNPLLLAGLVVKCIEGLSRMGFKVGWEALGSVLVPRLLCCIGCTIPDFGGMYYWIDQEEEFG